MIENDIITLDKINQHFKTNWANQIQHILEMGQLDELNQWYKSIGIKKLRLLEKHFLSSNEVEFDPPYLHPRKIWGIGLNYVEHATDLAEKTPDLFPASFMKADTTIIGHGDPILIPLLSEKTTGEAELGIVIKKKCKNIKKADWLDMVAGFTTIIDMTAEDILRKNPRYLTLSKNFDGFFSFGPQLITPDEFTSIMGIEVATVINGKVFAKNTPSNMKFPLDYLVSFHSTIMTLMPGDIISTGTPRAVALKNGDVIECRIDRFFSLKNPVIDLKSAKKIDEK